MEEHLPSDDAMDTSSVDQGVQGFWEGLKQKLDNDLTQEEFKRVILLMGDKTGKEQTERCECPSDLLNVLENNMLIEDALSTVEHVFNIMDHHPEYEEKSFGQIIRDHMVARRRFGCPNVIGREADIRKDIELLMKSNCKGIWIYGIGGLGKTVLANEICTRLYSSQNWDIITFDLKQVTSSGDFLRRLLAKFSVYVAHSDIQSLTNELIHHLKTISHDTIILLDNIEDVYASNKDDLSHILQRCLESLSDTPIKWLVTSRIEMGTNITIQGMEEVELLPLQRKCAKKLLKLSLRPIEVTKAQCKILLEMTGEVPLAIRLLSSAVKSSGLDKVSDDMLKPLLNAQLQNEMKDCIEYSFRYLEESEKLQLHLLSVVETTQFDIEIVKAVLEIKEQEALFLMMKLTNKQIVQKVQSRQKNMQYCFHPLIFEYMHDLMIDEELSLQAQNNFCKHMFESIEPYMANADRNYREVIAKVSDNRPLLKILFNVLSVRKDDRNSFLTIKRNRYLSQLQEMLQILVTQVQKEQLFKHLTEQMKNNHRKDSFVFWKLEEIQMLVDSKRFPEAKNEILILENIRFDKKSDAEWSAYLKGRFWYVKGRFFRCKEQKQLRDAIECFKTSLDVFSNARYIPENAIALNAIGNAYFDSGDFDNALFYHKQAVEMLRGFVPGHFHPDIALYEFNVGTIYLAKGRQEISAYNCLTEEASQNFKQALEIFKDSMAKDVQMGSDRMPKFANKLSGKAITLFHLNQYEEAISDLKRSLEIKIAQFRPPDQNITLAYFSTGRKFLHWREEIQTESQLSIAKQLLKEAIYCFRKAEYEIRSDGRACLTGRDKEKFIDLYKQIANEVKRDEARIIRSFCERFKRGVTFDSSSSSGSSNSSESSDPSSQEHSDIDEGIHSDDNENDQAAGYGIPCVDAQKQDALQFEKTFVSKINAQITDNDSKKRRRSSSESD